MPYIYVMNFLKRFSLRSQRYTEDTEMNENEIGGIIVDTAKTQTTATANLRRQRPKGGGVCAAGHRDARYKRLSRW